MLLTVSKRLEFSASRRLFVSRWTDEENLAAFGPETRSRYGTGRNYTAYFIFSGRVDPVTGMLINISEIKQRAGQIVDDRFDHKFLNDDNPAFSDVAPTVENIARQLFSDVAPLFLDVDARLVACHLVETSNRSATFYFDGGCEANYWFDFSAARQTMSPNLTAAENQSRFGAAASVHGHNYRTRLTFRKPNQEGPLVQQRDIDNCVDSIRQELDYRNLNEAPGLRGRPITTESLANYIRERVMASLPIHRVRLHERPDFFAEAWSEKDIFLGMQMPFSAAHRLHVHTFSDEQNVELFGKCDNPRGHGHTYVAEATIGGTYDERSGTLFDFEALHTALKTSLDPWRDRHLDLEADDFREIPSTGENIVRALWPKIDSGVNHQLVRLRLWETKNNRFTLRDAVAALYERRNNGQIRRSQTAATVISMKRILITGASRGIGRAIAEKLAEADVTLLLHGRDTVALAETCKAIQGRCAGVVKLIHDLATEKGVANLISQVGSDPLNVLVNNAGIAVVKPFREITLEEWKQTIGVNVTAPFLLMQRFAGQMLPGSSIVNILSVAAKTAFPNWSAYCMSKFALEGLSQSVRAELREHCIRVINIYPAATNTEIWDDVAGDWPRDKMISADQVADTVAYALSRPADVAVENITLSNAAGTL